ncbi:Polyamine oxidase [Choanephora cucurbitarum]|uniref:Polyamine oxidase n=1 Tax=Choanephora cucurbitarum TaxID=101091 RepID=A0A1C7NHB3_9FUNG|nr:Polyamine oxidase [Choanephora cucurbitarum]
MRSLFLTSSIVLLYGMLAQAKEYHTKVVILGGGVSGISAALNLTANNISNFMMVEARDILGGRAQDVPFADVNVEMGCNWVQGLGTNPINQLAIKYNLRTADTDGDNVVFYDEKGKVNATERYKDMNDAYTAMSEIADKRVKNDQVDISGRVGLSLAGWYPKNSVDDAIEYYVWDWEMGENPELSSTLFTVVNDYWTYGNKAFGPNSDGDHMVIDPRGFKHIFLQEAKRVFKHNDPRLLLNTTVTKVAYNGKGVTISTRQGDTIHADYAITTFSLGVLQHRDVEWEPPLPEWKLEGLYGFHMATYTKIFLNFPSKFWDDQQFIVYADPDQRGYYAAWQNLNAPGFLPNNSHSHIFFATVTQDMSYRVEAMEDDEVKEEIMQVLRRMYGDDIPEPTDFVFPRWHSNPLFRGSYSNWPIGEMDEHHANMKAPVKNRVFFAGEAMSEEYYGFLQGAWLSGAETAVHVAQCVKSTCPEAKFYPEIKKAKLEASIVRRSILENN